MKENLKAAADRMVKKRVKNANIWKLKIGTPVFVKIPKCTRVQFGEKYIGPYKILQVITPSLYKVQCQYTGKIKTRNYNQIKVAKSQVQLLRVSS